MSPNLRAQQKLAERLGTALRRFEHEGGSVDDLAHKVGETARDLRRWAEGTKLPGHVLSALLGELPRHLADDLIRPTGLRLVAREVDDQANALLAAAKLNDLAGTIARMMADGHLNHRERAELEQLAQATITELQPLAGE